MITGQTPRRHQQVEGELVRDPRLEWANTNVLAYPRILGIDELLDSLTSPIPPIVATFVTFISAVPQMIFINVALPFNLACFFVIHTKEG